MPYTPTQLAAAIDAIKATVSGKVEYNDLSGSLRTILAILEDMAYHNMIFQVSTISDLTALKGTDCTFVQATALSAGASAGIYSYRSSGTPNATDTFAATGGGVWRKAELANQS